MLALRWILGLASALGLAIFLLILTVGKGFDAFRSASVGDHPWRDAATLAIPALLVGMLATVLAPGWRPLAHVVAVGVVAAVIGCLTMVSEHPGEGGLYLTVLTLWLLYYLLSTWVGQGARQ